MNKKINIIFLNGVGSVGKTSIANALQDILDEPYLHPKFPEKIICSSQDLI